MNDIEILARAVLDMRHLQERVKHFQYRKKLNVYVDPDEFYETRHQMVDAEKKVHAMCLDILGVEEEEQ